MSDNNQNDQSNQPRQPHNLQALLKFAMEGKNSLTLRNLNTIFQIS